MSGKALRRTLPALGLGAALGCGPAGESWIARQPVQVELPGATVVPLLGERVPVISGLVDGHAARLLLDTGSDTTLLDAGFAARVGLPRVALGNEVTSSRGEAVARVFEAFTRVERLALGDAAALDIAPLLLDMDHLGLQLDGVVGMDVLGRWATAFDDEAQQVTILPSGEIGSALAGSFAEGARFTGWPWVSDDERPQITLAFTDDVEFVATIDTGAVFGSMPGSAVAALGLEASGAHGSHHVGGSDEVTTYRLPSLAFGDVTLTDVDMDAQPWDTGLVGYGMLKQFVFVVDGPARMFVFAYQPPRRDEDG